MVRTRFKRSDVSATIGSGSPRLGEADPIFADGQSAHMHRQRADLRERSVLAVTGLAAEARVAAGPGIAVISSGGCVVRLEGAMHKALAGNISAVISFGIAGGLAPKLPPGSVLVARKVVTENGESFESDRIWTQRLSTTLGGAPIVEIVGVDLPVAGPCQKRELFTKTGAVAVDMESHVAARIAHAHRLPFAAVRVVADPAERHVPHSAIVGMGPDGKVALGALLRSLLREPRQLPQLTRTALDASAAFATLLRSRKLIAGGLGFGDFSEFLLDMPREDVVCRPLPI